MTAEKRAEPTPGKWESRRYDPDWECASVVEASNTARDICHVFGEPAIATARAELFAAAPNTAAERDRLKADLEKTAGYAERLLLAGVDLAAERDDLKKVTAELVEALGKATEAFDIAISLTPTGPARNSLCDMNIEARAVLAKFKDLTLPESPEGVGG